jgi:voltage-dependent anion channel protein 2
VSLEVKTKTQGNAAFRVAGVQDNKSGAIAGDVELKYTNNPNGLAYTQAWTTSNILRSQLELENYMAKGLKLDLTTALNPDKNQKSAIMAATYKQAGVHGRAFLDVFKVSIRSPLRSYVC